MNSIVIYHANCWDGFCAAWLLKRAYPDTECIPAHYGTEPPHSAQLSGRRVFIVDFSYKRATLLDMAQWCNHITILDHHKTAQQELAELILPGMDITFDMSKSGGRLTWEYLNPGKDSPWIVDYTEDRDLWRWQLPDSREINAALRSYPLDFATWDKLAASGPDSLIPEGKAILRRESQIVADHVGHAQEIVMDGHKILAVNATVLFSEIAGELAKNRPFGACYFTRFDGKKQWSLRSREGGVDVSVIAKAHGGGGHPQAAGFEE